VYGRSQRTGFSSAVEPNTWMWKYTEAEPYFQHVVAMWGSVLLRQENCGYDL
jgi:hypothetical protein